MQTFLEETLEASHRRYRALSVVRLTVREQNQPAYLRRFYLYLHILKKKPEDSYVLRKWNRSYKIQREEITDGPNHGKIISLCKLCNCL